MIGLVLGAMMAIVGIAIGNQVLVVGGIIALVIGCAGLD